MKVILLKDVAKVGRKGEVVEVSDGYGRNFLVGRKLAEPATNEAIHAAKLSKAANVHRKELEKQEAQDLAQSLAGQRVVIKARTGNAGRLFGAVTSKEVSEAIETQCKAIIDKKNIEIPGNSIKTLGEHEVLLRVYAETTAKIIVEVVGE